MMKRTRASIVLGLGFGDEGKGLCTDFLCQDAENTLVIRFNGGQQAGHNVVLSNGKRHVFSNFGSGTMRGVPTYWSSFCSFSPAYFWEEYQSLDCSVKFFLDRNSPVTTHYEVLYNRAIETSRGEKRHGSCGAGFGATIDRQTHTDLQFFTFELFDQHLLTSKLALIRAFYKSKINLETQFDFDDFDHEREDERFHEYVLNIKTLIDQGTVMLTTEEHVHRTHKWDHLIFEGAQGIMLDQQFGFKPHITKSNTTSQNAMEIIRRNFDDNLVEIEIFYVTRAYHTRHGAGPFIQSNSTLSLINNQEETNFFNDYQREFKISHLDIDLVNYALSCDLLFSKDIAKNLLVTCLDQFRSESIGIIESGELRFENYQKLKNLLHTPLKKCYYSFGNTAQTILMDININA
ncbi:adenylosuccinate synthetase [Pedobacter paludis]|uniref:Adenylosuccinate synthetase n=1 Tax=Pedobacter paludis TaxID=2203212 RepID=A0A317F709_9SPHI|nr:adenylosuccinate synthetase [Pedobacter paludis]PWS33308.1 hypothetical protein DF947_01395 [Pedobacter paludis]